MTIIYLSKILVIIGTLLTATDLFGPVKLKKIRLFIKNILYKIISILVNLEEFKETLKYSNKFYLLIVIVFLSPYLGLIDSRITVFCYVIFMIVFIYEIVKYIRILITSPSNQFFHNALPVSRFWNYFFIICYLPVIILFSVLLVTIITISNVLISLFHGLEQLLIFPPKRLILILGLLLIVAGTIIA